MSDVQLPRRDAIVWTSVAILAAADPIVFACVVALFALYTAGTSADVSQIEFLLGA